MNKLTPDELQSIEKRAAAATPGKRISASFAESLIDAYRTDIPRLLAHIAAQAEEIAELDAENEEQAHDLVTWEEKYNAQTKERDELKAENAALRDRLRGHLCKDINPPKSVQVLVRRGDKVRITARDERNDHYWLGDLGNIKLPDRWWTLPEDSHE